MNKIAQLSKPMEVLVSLMLILPAVVGMLAFVHQLSDHTAFEQRMLVREAALTLSAAIAIPYPGFVRIFHQELPMEKFTFLLADKKVSVSVEGEDASVPFGAIARTREGAVPGAFVASEGDLLRIGADLPEHPLAKGCQAGGDLHKTLTIQLLAKKGERDQAVSWGEGLMSKIPSSLLGLVQTRRLDPDISEGTRRAQMDGHRTVIIQRVGEGRSMIFYALDKATSSSPLACALSTSLERAGQMVPVVPINTDFVAAEDPRSLLAGQDAVMLVWPQGLDGDQQVKAQGNSATDLFWKGMSAFYQGVVVNDG